jgi:hypothetical protein
MAHGQRRAADVDGAAVGPVRYARLLRRAMGGGAGAATFGRAGAGFGGISAFWSAFRRMLWNRCRTFSRSAGVKLDLGR